MRHCFTFLIAGFCAFAGPVAAQTPFTSIEDLGEALFHETNLSQNRTQSCATCHDPDFAFVDPRETDVGKAASLGDDGVSFGDRQAPTAAYAKFAPPFHFNEKTGRWTGGQFWDGREPDLAGQAGGPPLNPIEMGMPDKASVVARLQEDPAYVQGFESLFGSNIFDSPDQAYEALTQAIAAFEETDVFSPFDSKYDRYLAGTYKMTPQEELGRVLFFSPQFTNCALCHQLKRSAIDPQETFTNYEFHNIGVPVNTSLRSLNGVGAGFVDQGLLLNPKVENASEAGKFKVPTLRNVAVTGPYMHNGVFEDLRTVVLFYDHYNSLSKERQINPETQTPWGPMEVKETLSVTELTEGPALDDKRIDALVAFLRTLTDARYEHLLED